MTDNDLELHVKTTADLEAIRETEQAVKDLGDSTAAIPTMNVPGAGMLGIPPELLSGAPMPGLDQMSDRAKELLGAAKEAEGATSRVAREAHLAGGNFASAAIHAGILARGLANGHLELRAMNVLAHSLGTEYLAAGGAVGGIGAGLLLAVKYAQSQLKEQENIGKSLDDLIKKTHEWADAAKSVQTPKDVSELAKKMGPDIDAVSKKLKEASKLDIGEWKSSAERGLQSLDFLFRSYAGTWADLIPEMKMPFSDKARADFKKAQEDFETTNKTQARTIEDAISYQEKLNALLTGPTLDAIDKVSSELQKEEEHQNNINRATAEGREEYAKSIDKVEILNKRLEELQKTSDKNKENADKAYGSADENVRRVLMNEKAATDARAAGNERDADMYQKSAEQYKAGLSPALQDQLAKLKELQRLAYGGPPKPPEITWSQGETGTGGPSLIGAAAERARMQSIENTRKESAMSDSQKLDELIRLTREQVGLWR